MLLLAYSTCVQSREKQVYYEPKELSEYQLSLQTGELPPGQREQGLVFRSGCNSQCSSGNKSKINYIKINYIKVIIFSGILY